MCLIAFAWGVYPRFPFVIAANRDEFFERPTAPLSLWKSSNGTEILAGRDLQGGGTWMGFSPNGRFAMLTNVRNPNFSLPAEPLSRGGLVVDWLESDLPVNAWAQSLQAQRYPGFNLIVGDWQAKQCHYLSNQSSSVDDLMPFSPVAGMDHAGGAIYLVAHELSWGAVYGLSNAALDTPWPKTVRLKNTLSEGLAHTDAEQLIAAGLEALNHRSTPPDDQLPQTGVPIALERALSTAFVSYPAPMPNYGTRTSLVAVCEVDHGLRVTELTHPLGNAPALATQMSLNWPV